MGGRREGRREGGKKGRREGKAGRKEGRKAHQKTFSVLRGNSILNICIFSTSAKMNVRLIK